MSRLRPSAYDKRRADKQRDRTYGLQPGQYDSMFDEQDGRCAACGTDNFAPYVRPSVDHDHATGRIRALLCNRCNWVLGQVGDSADVLAQLAVYLERFR